MKLDELINSTPSQQNQPPIQQPADTSVSPQNSTQVQGNKMTLEQLVGKTNAPTPEQQPGFFKSTIQGIAKPFLRVATTGAKALVGIGGLATQGVGKLIGSKSIENVGKEAEANAMDTQPTDFGYFGKVQPLGTSEEGKQLTGGQTAKDIVGTGAELASYFVGGGEAAQGAKALATQGGKQLIKQSLKGAGEGAVIGGLGAGGAELQRPESTIGSTATQGLIGSILGASVGGLTPIGAGLAKETYQGVKKVLNPEVEDAIFRAIKPAKNNTNFTKDVSMAIPEVADTLKLKGVDTSKMSINDLDSAILDTKKRIWDTYEKTLSPNKHIEISTEPIAKAIESTITPRTELLNPSLAQRIKSSAEAYKAKGTISLGDAENFLHEANGELNSYYAKNKVGQAVARTDPEVAHTLKEADAIRENLYGKLDELTGGKSADIKKLYGALTNFGKEVSGRAQVVNRQAPASLQETIHYPWAIAKGVGSLVRGDIVGTAESAGQIAMSKAMKESNSTEGLIRKAFSKLSSKADNESSSLFPSKRTVPNGIKENLPKISPAQGTKVLIPRANNTSK